VRVHPRSHARVVLPLFATSALTAVLFIAAVVLFVAAQPTLGLIALSLSTIGFIVLFLLLRNEINHESKPKNIQNLPVAPELEWDDFVEANADFLFSPDRDESNAVTSGGAKASGNS
jgi:hypothetical protein